VGNQRLVGNQVVRDWLDHHVGLLDVEDVSGLHKRGVVNPSGMMVLAD